MSYLEKYSFSCCLLSVIRLRQAKHFSLNSGRQKEDNQSRISHGRGVRRTLVVKCLQCVRGMSVMCYVVLSLKSQWPLL